MNTDLLVVQVPRSMKIPALWDPRLTYELAAAKDQGTVTLVDWNLNRWRIDVVVEGVKQYEAKETLIWVPHMQGLARALDLQKRVGGKIAGVPKRDDIPWAPWVGEGSVRDLPKPDLSAFDTGLYWQTMSVVPTAEALMWKQRIPIQFRFPSGAVKPADAVKHLTHLKIGWWFDSAEWRDDLTEDPVWTMKLIRLLQEEGIRFEFSCRLDPAKVDQGYLQRLKDAGLRIADLGRIDICDYVRPEFERLEAALMACSKLGIAATYTNVIGSRDDEATIKAIETALRFNIIPRVDVNVPWDKLGLEEIQRIDLDGFYNPWVIDNLDFVGTVAALQQLSLAALE